MSHRAALTLSVVLTLVLAFGIIAGRDRLFTAEAALNTSNVTPASTVGAESKSRTSEREANATGPQVIEIPLPAATDGTSSRTITGESQPRGDRYNENGHEEDDD